MGIGYSLSCRTCGYEISGNLGVGFFFPRAYQQTMEAARAGKLGKTVKQFLEEHPDGTLNTENAFLQCTECGKLICGPALTMYTRNPDVPRREQEIWTAAAPQEEEDYVSPMELEQEDTYQFYGYGNVCGKCKKPMKPFLPDELTDPDSGYPESATRTRIPCPVCREPLLIDDIIMWD